MRVQRRRCLAAKAVAVQPVAAGPAPEAATANHIAPTHAPPPIAEAAATPDPIPSRAEPRERVLNTPTLAWELEAMRPPRAEPEAQTQSEGAAPAFVDTDTMLYAKDNARLRTAPDTAADVLSRLAFNEPLHAVARSADGAWWRVSLAGGRSGYVYRTAVAQDRIAKAKPSAAPPAPIETAEVPQPATQRRDGMLGYVDDTMDWFVDTAGQGRAPTVVRPEH